ncbi:MAG: T9SS type A sorting domain-containing protein [Stygiobacter sp.]
MKKKYIISITIIMLMFNQKLLSQYIGTGLGEHTIIVNIQGKVFAWGRNDNYGQLGNGTKINSKLPIAVTTTGVLNGKKIIQVASGVSHSFALSSDGKAYGWGYGNAGQLGNNDWTSVNTLPTEVTTSGALNGKIIKQIACGDYHTIALTIDGQVYSWGRNDYGQLGNSNQQNSNVPVKTLGLAKTIIQIAAGSRHSVALASDGTIFTWGNNDYGQLGDGNKTTIKNLPIEVNQTGSLSGKTVIQVAAGSNHTLALTSDGLVYAWGNNDSGQLGDGTNTLSTNAVPVSTLGVLKDKKIIKIAAGSKHSIALASDGTVYTWGDNWRGALGTGNYFNSKVPVAVSTTGALNGKKIIQISAGSGHSIALASDGKIYTWGDNSYGQLGNGNDSPSTVPVAVYQNEIGLMPVEKINNNLPDSFELSQNYPNPFNPSTKINWQLPVGGYTTLKVYDVLGNEVATLVDEYKNAGGYEVEFNVGQTSRLSSGVYFYRLQNGSFSQTRKFILMK